MVIGIKGRCYRLHTKLHLPIPYQQAVDFPQIFNQVLLILLQENRFTKCDVCSMIKRELEKTMDRVKREHLNSILEEHNKLQMYVNPCM